MRGSLMSLIACFFILGPGVAFGQQTIKIATGSNTGIYISLGKAICEALNARATGLTCEYQASKGSLANLVALKRGEVELGIVQSDVQYQAVTGTGTFAKIGKQSGLRSLFSAHSEALAVAVRPGTGIEDLDDLAGHRLDIGPIKSGTNLTMRLLFRYMGWSRKSFRALSLLEINKQQPALCAGEVDATAFLAGHPNSQTNTLIANCNARLLDVEGPAIDRLIADNPYYVRALVPLDAYVRLGYEVGTIGLLATVMSTDKVDPRVTYLVTKAVFENLDYIRRQRGSFKRLHPLEMARKGMTAPRHRGAERYLREAGRL